MTDEKPVPSTAGRRCYFAGRWWLVLAVACLGTQLTGCQPPPSTNPSLIYGVTGREPSFSIESGNWVRVVSWWTEAEPATSFGIPVCISGSDDLQLEGVRPISSVGAVEVLGSVLVTSTDQSDSIASLEGYPPKLSDSANIVEASGATVRGACGEDAGVQQILVGLRAVDTRGGGWEGVIVDYLVGEEPHHLEIPVDFMMCGTDTEPCGSGVSPPADPRPSAPTEPEELDATFPVDESPYAVLSSMRGTHERGPYAKDTDRVGVYVRCYGSDAVTVEIVGAASFDQQCLMDPTDPGTRNVIDVTFVDEILVRASAENSNMWAVSVTAVE